MKNASYDVVVWHGEGGSVAWILNDNEDCAGYTSTIRDGADWRTRAQEICDRANGKEPAHA